jgi:hypothetical protein
MGTVDYLTWSVLAMLGAFGSTMMLVVAERRAAYVQAYLAASAFGLWSAVAALCFWEAA